MRSLLADLERWPLREPFVISRRVFVDSLALTVQIREGDLAGRGECEPHEHEQIIGLEAHAQLLRLACDRDWLATLSTDNILDRLPNQPLRNALDCALWDLAAKRSGQRVWDLLDLGQGNPPVAIVPTVGLASPQDMAQAASALRGAKALKIKLGGSDGADAMRLEAIAAAAPGVELLADINGGWTPRQLRELLPLARRCGVSVIEQPLPPGQDAELPQPPTGLRFCADESCTDRSSLPLVAQHYQMINVKLDKTGGLTEALALVDAATVLGLPYMVGSNGGTSLAMAPLYVLAHGAALVDAGAGHLTVDREPMLRVERNHIYAPARTLWG